MIKNSYETLPCVGYQIDPIIKAIRLAKLGGFLLPIELSSGKQVPFCYLVTPASKEIPPFAHPIVIPNEHSPDAAPIYVADARGYMRMDSLGKYKVTARNEYDLLVLRTCLQKIWSEGTPTDILNSGNIQLSAFIRWVSEAIAQRMGLEPLAQMRTAVIAGIYFLSLYKKDVEDIKDSMLKMSTQVAKATYVPVDKVLEITDGLEPMVNLTDFCNALAKHGQTIRLESFNPALALGILCGGWFGFNSRETVAVALEHPPTWAALVYMALTDRSYRNCAIARYVDQCNKGDLGRTFTYNLARLPQDF